jgi:hypothetical protein
MKSITAVLLILALTSAAIGVDLPSSPRPVEHDPGPSHSQLGALARSLAHARENHFLRCSTFANLAEAARSEPYSITGLLRALPFVG